MDPFPEPQWLSKFDPSYWVTVRHWAGLAGLRILREHEAAVAPFPTADDLADLLYEHVVDHGSRWIVRERQAGKYRLNGDAIHELALSAAVFALDVFKPAYKPRFTREQAIRGGKNSKRPPLFTEEMLALVEGKSIAQQAQFLGCSPSTVSRIRRRIATQPDADQLILDQISVDWAAEQAVSKDTHSVRTPETGLEPETPEAPVDSIPESSAEDEFPDVETEVREIFASMGAFKLSTGDYYLRDPHEPPLRLEDVVPAPLAAFDVEAARRADEAEKVTLIPEGAFLDILTDPDPDSAPHATFDPWPTVEEDPLATLDVDALFHGIAV